MTTLRLDVSQRLNIVAMLDGAECPGGRREVWAVCRLQEQVDLNDDEKQAVGYRKLAGPDGREYVTWQLGNGVHRLKEFELTDDDLARLCRAIDGFRVVLARDRSWYEPLVAQLPLAEAAAVGARA
jgi:hypothetical protein